ncbi:hypothetical protein DL98DRAFT_155681 [Cadophora sp. DSE1049]|nr:hypothetical protein DL98DRAFT_155681 [Cadophora sp. DSE1049]
MPQYPDESLSQDEERIFLDELRIIRIPKRIARCSLVSCAPKTKCRSQVTSNRVLYVPSDRTPSVNSNPSRRADYWHDSNHLVTRHIMALRHNRTISASPGPFLPSRCPMSRRTRLRLPLLLLMPTPAALRISFPWRPACVLPGCSPQICQRVRQGNQGQQGKQGKSTQ